LINAVRKGDRSVATCCHTGAGDRVSCPAIGDYSGQNARLPRRALREFQTADAGMPYARRSVGRGEIFVRVPKCAVIHRINLHCGIIAPAPGLWGEQLAPLWAATGE